VTLPLQIIPGSTEGTYTIGWRHPEVGPIRCELFGPALAFPEANYLIYNMAHNGHPVILPNPPRAQTLSEALCKSLPSSALSPSSSERPANSPAPRNSSTSPFSPARKPRQPR